MGLFATVVDHRPAPARLDEEAGGTVAAAGWHGSIIAPRTSPEAIPDLRIDIEEVIVTTDTVVFRSTFRGTDTGGYAGWPPTGRTVQEWVVTIMHLEGEKVIREWIGADKLGLFIQLGVVSDPWPK